MATLYKTSGEKVTISPRRKRFSLTELQELVDGYIEYIYLEDHVLVVNEEGRLYGLPVNPGATQLVRQFGYDFIVGDAVYCRKAEV